MPHWAAEYLQLCRRLAPTTQETYQRDRERYVLPRFGHDRLGQLPADEIENWLNDEMVAGLAPSSVHRYYRTLRRMLQVAVQKQKLLANPCDRVDPPRVPKREMTFLDWDEAMRLAEAHGERYRALIYAALDSGMRWSELVGLRRGKVELRDRKVRVTEQLVQLSDGTFHRKEPQDRGPRALDHDLRVHSDTVGGSCRPVRQGTASPPLAFQPNWPSDPGYGH